MKIVKFVNFSGQDFSWEYDHVPYHFPAGSETMLEDFKAEHFAKHLVDREMTKMADAQRQQQLAAGKTENQLKVLRTDDPSRKEWLTKCVIDTTVEAPASQAETVVANENEKEEKLGKTVGKRGSRKIKKVESDDDDFEGLKT